MTDVFKLAMAFAVANKHPDPEAYAQSVADAHDESEKTTPVEVTPAYPPII